MLHASVSGKGQAVLLLHGLFGMGDNLSKVARSLSDNFRVFTLDLPNHGRSPRTYAMNFDQVAVEVLAFMDHHKLDRASVVGHSLGGKVAMQLALQQPQRIDRLVVADIAPVLYRAGHDDVFAGLKAVELTSLASRRDADAVLKHYIDNSAVRLFILKNLYRDDTGAFAWRMDVAALQRSYDDLRQANHGSMPFSGPTLFIKGELSNYIGAEHRETILRLFPLAELKVIQGAGHWLHAEKPAVFTNLVKRFLLPVNQL